jgi:hypothetical protein
VSCHGPGKGGQLVSVCLSAPACPTGFMPTSSGGCFTQNCVAYADYTNTSCSTCAANYTLEQFQTLCGKPRQTPC